MRNPFSLVVALILFASVAGGTEVRARTKTGGQSGPDGLVLVKEFVEGETLHEVAGLGALLPNRLSGLAELAATLIAIGYTADLAPSNLVLDRWLSRWTLVDAGGFKPGAGFSVLGQLWRDEYFGRDPALRPAAKLRFLTNLRIRLGAGSAAWKELVRNADRVPGLRKSLEELAAFDAERPPPRVAFESEAEDAALSDRMVSYGSVRKALGFDPEAVKNRVRLRLDDQGKLNTRIDRIEPPGRPPMVVKRANKDIIRRELATRRIVRRWFAKYFATPRSLGWGEGMVMEYASGSPSYGRTMLDLESRAAFAVLIDFEQSLWPTHPHFSRLPIDSILEEMPWVAREKGNRIQDYLPAVEAWRRIFARPETARELETILLESGFTKAEVPGLLETFRRNVAVLDLAILADVEYANDCAESRESPAR